MYVVDDVVLGVELTHQLQAIALIHPGVHLTGIEAKRNGAAHCSTAAPEKANYQRVAGKSQWSPEIESELESVAPISPQELQAICLLLGDELDSLFNN